MKKSEDYKLMVQTLMEQGRKVYQELEDSLFGNKKLTDLGIDYIRKLESINDAARLLSKKYLSSLEGFGMIQGIAFIDSLEEYFVAVGDALSPISDKLSDKENQSKSPMERKRSEKGTEAKIVAMMSELFGVDPESFVKVNKL